MNNLSFYLITGEWTDQKQFLEFLEISLRAGIKRVQIRAKSLNYDDYKKIAAEAVELCHQYQAQALISVYQDLVKKVNADGLHLPSAEFMKLDERPISDKYLLSVACHNEAQIMHATKINSDFAVMSPIFATPSSPQGNPLGWEKFSSLAALSTIPVYALGGLTPKDLPIAQSNGAVGIAAIRSLWGIVRC